MNNRVMQIIKILLSHEGVMIIDDIAEKINVSNKTTRNDLKSVEKLLEENDLRLIRKTGVGIHIEGEERAKLKMLSKVQNYRSISHQYSSGDRQIYILGQLLINRRKVNTTSLQEELFISRPSVYKDLEKVEAWLKERDILMVQDRRQGIVLQAGEKRIRQAMLDLYFLCDEYDKAFDILEKGQNSPGEDYASTNFLSYGQKEDILGVDYEKINRIIQKVEEVLNIKFTPLDSERLTMKFCIAISRMLESKFVDMKARTMRDLKELKQYEKMAIIFEEIEEKFSIKISPEERSYLFGLIIVSKTHFENEDWNVDEQMLVINKIVAREIMEITKESYFIGDQDSFYSGLVHHLKSATNKMKYGLEFQNKTLKEIKANYPYAFDIALKCKPIFQEYYNYSIPMEEVGYIALHIASAIERSKQPLSVYLVYHNSYSEVKLMAEVLRNNFNQLRIKKLIPLSMVDEIDDGKVDIIISTKKIDDLEGDSIILPSILMQEDMQKFSKIIQEIYSRKNLKRLKKVP